MAISGSNGSSSWGRAPRMHLAALLAALLITAIVGAFVISTSTMRGARAQVPQGQDAIYITGCMNITSPGYYVISTNITGLQAAGYCIGVFASDVVINGSGHWLIGSKQGVGIYVAPGSTNVTIEDVAVTSYYGGILVNSSGVRMVESTVSGNNWFDVNINGNNDFIANSTVTVSGNNWFDVNVFGSYDSIVDSNVSGDVYFNGNNDSIVKSTVSGNYWYGVYFNGNNDSIVSSKVSDNQGYGVYVFGSYDSIVSSNVSGNSVSVDVNGNNDFIVSSTLSGVYFNGNNNSIVSSNVSGYVYFNGNNNFIASSTVSDVDIFGSYDSIVDSEVSNVYVNAPDNGFVGDRFQGGGLYLSGPEYEVVANDTVNGRPLVYLYDAWNVTVRDAGQVIAVDSNGLRVIGVNVSYATEGVQLWDVDDSVIEDVVASGNSVGVIVNGNNDSIVNSTVSGNHWYGVIVNGNNDSIVNSTVSGNHWYGVDVFGSYDSIVSSNVSGYVDVNGNNDSIASSKVYGVDVFGSYDSIVDSEVSVYVYFNGNNDSIVSSNVSGYVDIFGSYDLIVDSNDSSGINVTGSYNSFVGDRFQGGGLYLSGPEYEVVANDTVNGRPLVYLYDAWNVTVRDAGQVIAVDSNGLRVIGVNVSYATEGVQLWDVDDSVIEDVVAVGDNYYGIEITGNNDSVINSTVSNNAIGVSIVGNNDSIVNSTLSYNSFYGIYLYGDSGTLITGNIISNNGACGLLMNGSRGDLIYNNLFNNTVNVCIESGFAYWNVSLRPGKNIVGGDMIGGNAWLSPNGTGFSQVTPPLPDDPYICDKPYVISGNNTDYLPLKYPFSNASILNATYSVTFVETGLPPGTPWSVTLNGTTRSSTSSTITFIVPPGTYSYTVSPVDGYVPSPSSGTIVVTRQNVTVYVNFTSTSITVNVFNVNGKPASTVPGVVYGVLVNSSGAQVGVQYMNNDSQIVFENVVPGTYTLYIYHYPNTGLNKTEYWGSLTISVAGGRSETYDFVRDMPYIDDISAYPLGNGTYLVKVLIINPQNASISGVVTVYISSQENLSGPGPQALTQLTVLSHGLNTVDITYSQSQPGTYYAYVVLQSYVQQPLGQPVVTDQYNWTELIQIAGYSITFNETGLPPGTPWSVTLNGTTKSSTSSTITFIVPPGVYYYNVTTSATNFVALNGSGTIDVNKNETIHIIFVQVNETSIKVYSEYVGYFLYGFSEPNVFYVQIANGTQPINVTGYIMPGNVQVSFTYNDSIGMWQSNTINMGQLPPGINYLIVRANYPGGRAILTTYRVVSLQPPPIIIWITHVPQGFSLSISSNSSNVSGINISVTFMPYHVNLYNNSFIIDIDLGVELNQTPVQVPVRYVNGSFGLGIFDINIEFRYYSNGTMTVGAGSNIIHVNGSVMSYPISINDAIYVSGTLNIYNNYTIQLENLVVGNGFSASMTFDLPSPWSFNILGIKAGVIPTVSVAIDNNISLYLVPTNNPQQEILGIIPLAIQSVRGHVFIPFSVTGLVGGGVQEGGSGIGFYLYAQGVLGVGMYYGIVPALSDRGGAVIGELNVGYMINLIYKHASGHATLLNGVIFKWGNITSSELSELELQLEEASQEFVGQAVGSDWVNGSTYGLIAGNIPLGYSYSVSPYNGSEYVYYTANLPNGTTWIDGAVFRGTYEYSAPLPAFEGIGVASPYLIRTPNNSLMMVWFAVPEGNYLLNNLTILLQGSILEPDGVWGPVFNLTSKGVALSVTSDGKYLYIIWEPTLSLNYNNTELIVESLNGSVIDSIPLPNAVALNGASNGSVVVQFLNGTYAVLQVATRSIVQYPGYSEVGFSDGLFYAFSSGTLKLTGDSYNITIHMPYASYVWPGIADGHLYLLAYSQSVLSIYVWNGSALSLLSSYALPGLVIAKPAYSEGFLYVTALCRSLNSTNMTGYLLNIIAETPPPTITSTPPTTTTTPVSVITATTTVTTTTTSTTTSTTTTTTTATTTVTTTTTSTTTSTTTTTTTATTTVTTTTTSTITTTIPTVTPTSGLSRSMTTTSAPSVLPFADVVLIVVVVVMAGALALVFRRRR